MGFGCVTRAGPVTITCTRNTVTLLWMVPWNICTLKWPLATGSGPLAFKLSRLPPSQPNYARGKAPSNSTTPRSSSPWCSGRSDHQVGSWKLHTRHQGPTCLCKLSISDNSMVKRELRVGSISEDIFGSNLCVSCFWLLHTCFCWEYYY